MEKSLYPEEMWPELYETYPEVFPKPTTEQLLDAEAKKIRQHYAQLMDGIVKPYSKTEQLTWDTQVKEADAYLADNSVYTPLLSALAANRGITLQNLIELVKENDNSFRVAIGTLLGRQQAELAALYINNQKENT